VIKVVKTITIVLGIFICIALGMLGYGFYSKDKGEQNQPSEVAKHTLMPSPILSLSAGADIGGISLGQPQGSSIAAVQPQGVLVYVTVQGGGQADRVLIVDLQMRRVIGQLSLGGMEPSYATPKPLPANPGAIAPAAKK